MSIKSPADITTSPIGVDGQEEMMVNPDLVGGSDVRLRPQDKGKQKEQLPLADVGERLSESIDSEDSMILELAARPTPHLTVM